MAKSVFRVAVTSVTFVPFESEMRRDQSYRMWIDSFDHMMKLPDCHDSQPLEPDCNYQSKQDAA